MPEAIAYQIYDMLPGKVLVAASALGITSLLIGGEEEELYTKLQHAMPDKWLVNSSTPLLENMRRALAQYFAGEEIGWNSAPLDVRGTDFQQRVWHALVEIPAGSTVSYSDLAEHIGKPRAVRAVASACAANPICIAIPCHRVIHKDGNVSGYAAGTETKLRLLALEHALESEAA